MTLILSLNVSKHLPLLFVKQSEIPLHLLAHVQLDFWGDVVGGLPVAMLDSSTIVIVVRILLFLVDASELRSWVYFIERWSHLSKIHYQLIFLSGIIKTTIISTHVLEDPSVQDKSLITSLGFPKIDGFDKFAIGAQDRLAPIYS